MKIEDIKFSLIKYRMDTFKLIINGLSEPFNVELSFIKSITIEKDYDNFLFPFFQVEVLLPSTIYRLMQKDNFNIKAVIDFQCARFTDPVHSENTKSPTFMSDIKDSFYVFLDDISPDVYEGINQEKEQEQGTYKKGYSYGDLRTVKLLLYKEDYLFNSNTIVNGVLTSATLADALTYTLNKAGLRNVLLSPPNNYKMYKEFIITPIRAKDQIYRICNEYGLHNTGTIIFFDLKKLFIVDKSPKCTAYVQNEYKTTHLVSLVNSSLDSTRAKGCYANTVERYNVANIVPDTISVNTQSSINDHLYGKNIISIDTKTATINKINSSAPSSIKSSSPSNIIINSSGDNTNNAIKHSLNESGRVITLGFSYVNIGMFEPNKEFILNIDDARFKRYNGKYRISRMIGVFEKEGDYWTPHVTVELRG